MDAAGTRSRYCPANTVRPSPASLVEPSPLVSAPVIVMAIGAPGAGCVHDQVPWALGGTLGHAVNTGWPHDPSTNAVPAGMPARSSVNVNGPASGEMPLPLGPVPCTPNAPTTTSASPFG